MIPTFQAACKSRATRLGVPPSPDEPATFDQSENLTSMHFKQLYSVLKLPLVQNKKKTSVLVLRGIPQLGRFSKTFFHHHTRPLGTQN